ncbi:MAG: hypothetical protein ACK54P_10140, partial [Bacteroidota bacterium]
MFRFRSCGDFGQRNFFLSAARDWSCASKSAARVIRVPGNNPTPRQPHKTREALQTREALPDARSAPRRAKHSPTREALPDVRSAPNTPSAARDWSCASKSAARVIRVPENNPTPRQPHPTREALQTREALPDARSAPDVRSTPRRAKHPRRAQRSPTCEALPDVRSTPRRAKRSKTSINHTFAQNFQLMPS